MSRRRLVTLFVASAALAAAAAALGALGTRRAQAGAVRVRAGTHGTHGRPRGTRAQGRHAHAGVSPRPFDVERAYALVKLQLAYGPRPAGSTAERRVAEVLRPMLPGGHFEPVPGGLRNIVGGLPGGEPAIVVGAHYDTTPVAGYVGANNSAAGVGAVIELAPDLAADPRRPADAAIRFVLFDGEEAPAGYVDFLAQGVRGSRAYVAAHASGTRELVLLDVIALRNEVLPRELGSDPALWGRLRAAAVRAREGAYFPPTTAAEVLDDHTPFMRARIPAVDLIDFDYPCWQQRCDDLSQVSKRSLVAVGASVLALLRDERSG
jgi:peptidase M28-like protein